MKNSLQILLCLFMVMPTVLQANHRTDILPDSYPSSFQRSGVIDNVHFQQRSITIHDSSYQLANITPIHTPKNGNIAFSMLKADDKIGFSYISSKKMITEIWVLPSNYNNTHD